ncbi:MAG: S41 family peptidase [Candidatus Cloacimonetes bacterium]|nr:S41 family peptidase [Candidatus Cloacimonadota bacterium]
MHNTLKRLGLLAIILASFLMGHWAFHGVPQRQDYSSADSIITNLHLFNEIMVMLDRHYVNDIASGEMIRDAIEGAIDNLDPHTRYFDTAEFTRFQDDTAGHFGGIGLTIQSIDDTITVMSIIPDAPAWEAGILTGDRILSVDGHNLVGASEDEAVEHIRGEEGSRVQITLMSLGNGGERSCDLLRDRIKIDSVPYSFMLDSDIGYIRLQQFNANATSELSATLDKFAREGAKGLVIDLRNNPGGLLSEAIDTVGEFLGPDKLVVSTRGRLPEYDQDFYTRFEGHQPSLPIVVLINEASASASEIFAGAMQDYDCALIMGEVSFGKGSVQQLFPLTEGGLKLTTSYYYIPSGRCIHKPQNDDLLRSRPVNLNGAFNAGDTSAEFHTSSGRTVEGGGGVTPDIQFTPVLLGGAATSLRARNTFFHFTSNLLQQRQTVITPASRLSEADIESYFQRYASTDEIREELEPDMEWVLTELQATYLDMGLNAAAGQRLRVEIDPLVTQARRLLAQAETQEQLFALAETTEPVASRQGFHP